VIVAILILCAAGTVLALVLANSTTNTTQRVQALTDRLNEHLPQTQCGRCTFTGCKPYAAAIARGEADINQCPPGGDATAAMLATLLGRQPKPVDRKFGVVHAQPLVAWIDEPACIGCTKCIQACPVDAIVGASKFMHTIITAQCTGCELCIPPCPVDCIEMRVADSLAAPTGVLAKATAAETVS
jgi:Na+-translocating ferredoxin:NAD+ oxidoreductase subunit B